jgi:hypothetical protein
MWKRLDFLLAPKSGDKTEGKEISAQSHEELPVRGSMEPGAMVHIYHPSPLEPAAGGSQVSH